MKKKVFIQVILSLQPHHGSTRQVFPDTAPQMVVLPFGGRLGAPRSHPWIHQEASQYQI